MWNVCLQHDSHFRRPSRRPHPGYAARVEDAVVTTLHTILREPKPDQRRVIEELIALSTRLV